MFIGQHLKRQDQLRSEERNPTRTSPLWYPSAPPNGAGRGFASRSIDMSPLAGLNQLTPPERTMTK
jgi:hypothetical protein